MKNKFVKKGRADMQFYYDLRETGHSDRISRFIMLNYYKRQDLIEKFWKDQTMNCLVKRPKK